MRNPGRLIVPGEVPLPDDLPTREPNPLADLLKTGHVHVDAEMAGQLDQNLRANFSGEAWMAMQLMAGSSSSKAILGDYRLDAGTEYGHYHEELKDFAMFYNSATQSIANAAWTNISFPTAAYAGAYNTSNVSSNEVVFGRTGWWLVVIGVGPSDQSGGTTRRLDLVVAGSIWVPFTEYMRMYQNKDSGNRWAGQSFGLVKVTGTGARLAGQMYHNAGSSMSIGVGKNFCFVQWLAPT